MPRSDRVNRTDHLLGELIRRILSGALPPGGRLPPERDLAALLGTDRTSLRVALAQLKRMNLLTAVQGSGTVLLDYRYQAGVDFFLHVFRLPEPPIDDVLLSHMVEYWSLTMPGVFARVAQRATAADFDRIEGGYRRQAEAGGDLDEAVAAALEAIDAAVQATRNVIFRMTYRSVRPLRERVLRLLFPASDVTANARANLAWIRALREGLVPPGEVEARYRRHLAMVFPDAAEVKARLARTDRSGLYVPPPLDEFRARCEGPPRRENAADRLASELLRQVVDGALAPGEAFPSERALVARLGVDRTTLRQALAQLKSLGVLSSRQGAGHVVRDPEEAGIDFYAEVFRRDDTLAEPALLRQVMEYLNATVPPVVGLAARRASPEGVARLREVFLAQAQAAGDPDRVAEWMVLGQDLFAAATENRIVDLVYRSTRPLRLRLQRHVARSVDLRRRAAAYLELLQGFERGSLPAEALEALYRSVQVGVLEETRQALVASSAA